MPTSVDDSAEQECETRQIKITFPLQLSLHSVAVGAEAISWDLGSHKVFCVCVQHLHQCAPAPTAATSMCCKGQSHLAEASGCEQDGTAQHVHHEDPRGRRH